MQSLSSFRKPDTNKTMGVEIEGYFHLDNDPYISARTYYGFFYATNDGSINPPNDRDWVSRELVSQPLPRNWLKKEVNKLFKKIKLHSNESCGVHVHVSSKWLSEKKAHKIQAFYASLRPGEQELLFGRKSNLYCLTDINITKTRYNAINATNANTIEFRMFKSGDASWVCYCLDMVDYLIRQANTLNIDTALAFRDDWNNKHA